MKKKKGQEPEPTNDDAPQDGEQTFTADYVATLRAENAKHRTNASTLKKQLAEVQPLAEKFQQQEEAQKSEVQKALDELASMQLQLETANAAVDLADKQQVLLALASKAGVNADVLPFLNVAAFDLDDEAKTLEALKVLARPGNSSGGASNPGRGPQTESDENRRTRIFGGGDSSIFRSG